MSFASDILALCSTVASDPLAGGFSFLLLGLVAGSLHCSMICGPVVVFVEGGLARPNGLGMIGFHLGRLVTYLALALAASLLATGFFTLLGDRFWLSAAALIAAALLILATARHKPVPQIPAASRAVDYALGHLGHLPGNMRLFLTGLLTGFMPCGMTLAVLMVVLARGDALGGVIIMASFWLGTTTVLTLVSRISRLSSKTKFSSIRSRPRRLYPALAALWLVGASAFGLIAA